MSATLSLEPDAVLRLRWNGTVPSVALDKAVRSVPGAREIQGGYEWGWWAEVAARLSVMPGLDAGWSALSAWPGASSGSILGDDGWTWVSPERVAAVEWRSPTLPRPHQLAFKAWRRGGGRDGLWHPACLVEAGLGTGKSLSAIEEILELLVYRPRARVLVLCRASLVETVWGRQLDEHAAGLPFLLLRPPRSRKLAQLALLNGKGIARHAVVVVHSHEDLPAMGKVLAEVEWDMIVVDEIARFRTASAQRTGRLTGYQARPLTAPYRLALSGLPMIKSPYDLYPMLRWLGAPTGNKAQFAQRFMAVQPFTREEILIDEPGLRSLLDSCRFQVPKSTVLNIPRSWQYERVALKPWQRARYSKVRKELAARDAGQLASTQLEELLRLAQVAAGFEPPRYRSDNAKLEHLLQRVLPSLSGEEQVVIWTRFRDEAIGVAHVLNGSGVTAGAYTGALSDAENATSLRDFESGHDRVLVATLAKGAIGLNLPQARTMIYLTRDFDTESFLQSLERNVRLTTKHSDTRVVVIEAEHTIDQKITQVLGDDAHAAARLTALDVKEVLGS